MFSIMLLIFLYLATTTSRVSLIDITYVLFCLVHLAETSNHCKIDGKDVLKNSSSTAADHLTEEEQKCENTRNEETPMSHEKYE